MNTGVAATLFGLLVFPGLLFTAVVGMVATWIDRKVTARLQWRVGPPFFQPFYDFLKLLGKEVTIPRGASKTVFLAAPLVGLAGVVLSATILGRAAMGATEGFTGDVVVVLYLLVLPSLAVIVGAAASKNPLASVGASREMKLVVSYELPFILAMLVAVVKSGGELRLPALLAWQAENGAFAARLSGLVALVVAVLCMQAKLALVPFDQAEAETEIMSGALIEYGGAPLAVFKLTRAMMMLVGPAYVIVVLWGGFGNSPGSLVVGVLKYVALLVAAILIRNTNPRLKIADAMKFFWGPVTLAAIAAMVLAFLGV